MNDLSRLLRMPMKSIEAIVLVSWLKTILTDYQRSAIVLCKNSEMAEFLGRLLEPLAG
jgi:hypothetical protein